MWNVENFCKETFQWLLHLTDLIKIGVGERNLILKVRLKKHTSFTPIWKGKAAFQARTSRQGGEKDKTHDEFKLSTEMYPNYPNR